MAKRVARAICKAKGLEPDWRPTATFPTNLEQHLPQASTAIAAMREITPGMDNAVGNMLPDMPAGGVSPQEIWNVFIDAALEPETVNPLAQRAGA